MNKYSNNSNSSPALVADIGGTNARFALADKGKVFEEKVLAVKDFNHPRDAIQTYFEDVGIKAEQGCIAVACPVHTNPIQLTNSHWQFFPDSLSKELNFSRLKIINDFTALSLAVPLMKEQDVIKFGSGIVIDEKPIGVLGPGTGLGMSGLIHSNSGWIPLQGEGGHISYSAQTELEIEVVRILHKEFPRVSAERILTGDGIQRLYRTMCIINDKATENLQPHQIAELAISKKDDSCVSAMDIFAAALGDVAGDLGLVLGAFGGIYLGGGIVSKHHKYFIQSSLRRRFENKGRFDSYMRDIPTFIIHCELSALKGCAVAIGE
ncbi:MAG: glucokinase [Candidatus Portiera sp.]|nr:glucokinase [Portiera sp.]